jgi:phosphomannomutase / phosphoglucomutase
MTSQPAANRFALASLLLMAVGGLALLAGTVFLVMLWLSPTDPDNARTAARENAEAVAAALADINQRLAEETVLEQARRVPPDDPVQTAGVADALAGLGIDNLIDLRVYPPRAEEIEVGSYPDPDFTTVQMLIEARRRGTARARLQQHGTADEHLAFAQAVPGVGDEVAAILLLRHSTDPVFNSLNAPTGAAWIRLVQGSRVLGSMPPEIEAESLGTESIEGSVMSVEWGVPPASGPLSEIHSMIVMLVGLVLAAIGAFLRFGSSRKPAQRRHPAAAAPQAAAPAPSAKPRPAPRKPAPPPPASSEPKPDLPDWLLDEGGASGEADQSSSADGEGARTEASADLSRATEAPDGAGSDDQLDLPADDDEDQEPAGGDALELDVPDLDDILRQIDDEGDEPAASKPTQSADSDPEPEPDPEPEDETVAPESGDSPGGSVDIGEGLAWLTDTADVDPESEEDTAAPEADDADEEVSTGLELESSAESDSRLTERSKKDPIGDGGLELESDSDRPKDAGEENAEALADESSDASSESGLDLESLSEPESEPDQDLETGLDLEKELETRPESEPEPESELEVEPEPPPEPEPEDALSPEVLAVIEASEKFSVDIFDEDGIRGVFEDTLDAPLASLVGRAIGTLAVQQGHGTVVVGRDGRTSGPLLLSALIRGLRNTGLDVIEAGAVPTPALWYAAHEMANGCGVMVTASHHPPEHNGFKVMLDGRVLGRRQLIEMAELAIAEEFVEGEGGYTQEEVAPQYATALADRVELKRPLKMVVDCGNGIAGSVVPVLFEALGADVIPLYCDVDGGFPNHAPNPTDPECLEDLRLCVRNFQAELGIAFDGDADRLVLIGNDSEVTGTDQVLMLLAQSLLEDQSAGKVVMDVRCASQLKAVVKDAGGQVVVSGAGGVAMSNRVIDEGAVLGGEMGGQIVIAEGWYPFADAIFAAARIAELFAAGKHSVQERLAELPQFRTAGDLLIASDEVRGRELIAELRHKTDFGDGELTTVDGLRVDYPDRWALIRVQPGRGALELRFCGTDSSTLAQIKGEFREWILAIDPDLPLPY